MTSAILISCMIVLYTLQSLLCKQYSVHYPGREDNASPVFTVVSGLTVFALSLVLMGFRFEASLLTVILSLINAVALIGYNACIIKASQTGSYSILMTFAIAGSISIPTVVSVVAFDAPMSALKSVGVVGVLASVYMVSHRKEQNTKMSKWFIPICLLLALCNGAYGTLLDVQQRLTGTDQKEEMVAITYGVAALGSALMMLIQNKKGTFSMFRQNKKSLIYLITCSLSVAGAIHLLVYILPLINVTVLYTIDNSSVLLISVLLSCILYKEKLSVLNIIGCVVMCASLVTVAIF